MGLFVLDTEPEQVLYGKTPSDAVLVYVRGKVQLFHTADVSYSDCWTFEILTS